jgi:DNA-binding response OmpR family regulator
MAQNRSILVVDDEEDCRAVVRTVLQTNGFTVEDAGSGQEAIEKIQSCNPALVILDIMMPGMSGYDVVVHMKQKPETQNIPVMMLSAKGDYDDLILGYKDYGVEYYITKPFTSRQLLAGIKLVLGYC